MPCPQRTLDVPAPAGARTWSDWRIAALLGLLALRVGGGGGGRRRTDGPKPETPAAGHPGHGPPRGRRAGPRRRAGAERPARPALPARARRAAHPPGGDGRGRRHRRALRPRGPGRRVPLPSRWPTRTSHVTLAFRPSRSRRIVGANDLEVEICDVRDRRPARDVRAAASPPRLADVRGLRRRGATTSSCACEAGHTPYVLRCGSTGPRGRRRRRQGRVDPRRRRRRAARAAAATARARTCSSACGRGPTREAVRRPLRPRGSAPDGRLGSLRLRFPAGPGAGGRGAPRSPTPGASVSPPTTAVAVRRARLARAAPADRWSRTIPSSPASGTCGSSGAPAPGR